jgi:hypothetical protein
VFHDVHTPESQDAITACFKPFGASPIIPQGFFITVLTAIDFDDQLRARAKEIGDIRSICC